MNKKIILFSALLIGIAASAQDSSKLLNSVVLTATKYPTKQSLTGKVVLVISQEQLQKSAGKTLGEVLNQQAAATISGANNTAGTNQSIYLQGSGSANTLILLDGVPLYDPAGITSEFDLNNFSISDLERIEILKGAQSTLYGSDAVAGVINLISKKSGDKKLNFNNTLSAGSYNTYKGSAGINGNGDGYAYSLSYAKTDSKGFSSACDSTGNKNFDKDRFKQDVLSGSFSLVKEKKYDARIYGRYNIYSADIDAGAFLDDKDFRYTNKNFQTGTNSEYNFGKSVLHLNYNYNWYDRHFKDDSTSIGSYAKYQKGDYTGYSHFAELYGKFELDEKLNLLAGTDYRSNSTDQQYSAVTGFGPLTTPRLDHDSIKTNQFSAYSSLFYHDKGLSVEGGGRWNHHNVYGSNATFSFNPSYLIKEKYKIFTNISSGFRAPSLYQLYSEFGNIKLKPEQSVNYEAGLQLLLENTMIRVVWFKRDIHNVFYFYTDPVTYQSQYRNQDKQKDHGIETEFNWRSDKVNISANYAFVDGNISTKDFAGKDTSYSNLFRRPKHTFNFTIGFIPVKDCYISAHFKTVSKTFEEQFFGAPIKLDGYYTIDLYTEYQVHKSVKLFVDLQNVTDQKYFDVLGFNTKRVNVNVGVNIKL